MKKLFVLFILFLASSSVICQQGKTTHIFLKTILSADGVKDTTKLNNYISYYDSISEEAKKVISQEDNNYDMQEALFNFLEENYLKKYTETSYFKDLLAKKEFNCVTSVILYYLICTDNKLNINLYEAPYHVYITANSNENKEFTIELTDPVDGFDFEPDKDKYINYLLDYKLITQKELNIKGTDKIYNEYIYKSNKITPKKLLSIYYSNLANYQLTNNHNYSAYRLIKKAVLADPDSSNIISHNLIWAINTYDLSNNIDSLSSFLIETIDSIPDSKDFRKSLAEASTNAVQSNLDKNNFETAEEIYNKLNRILPEETKSNPTMSEMDIDIESKKAISKAIRGNYEQAFTIAHKLFHKYPDKDKILDLYINTGNSFINNLGISGEYDKMMKVSDTLFSDVPNIKSVQNLYALSRFSFVITSKLFERNINKAKDIIMNAYKKMPDNNLLKKSVGVIYHEMAMKEIRHKNYKNAVNLLKKGLIYDPGEYDLEYELKLTLDLIKNK